MDRAYSFLEIKEVDEDARVITGIASTPTPDRMGDIVEPMGAQYALPLPFLWQHKHDKPIGHVEYAKPTKQGIPFRVKLAKVVEDGPLKELLDFAWQSIKAKLVRAVSIGFRVLAYENMADGGWRITEWEWLELSAVTIPANADATIDSIKSIDRRYLAASGRKDSGGQRDTPGASGTSKTSNSGNVTMKSINEQIGEIEARRAEIATEMKGFGDVAELDAEQAEQFDTLAKELSDSEPTLNRLKAMATALGTATVVKGGDQDSSGRSRIVVPAAPKIELPKGTKFARYAMAVAAGKGSISDTLAYAKRWDSQTPEVSAFIKATVGTVAEVSPGWGSELAQPQNLASEFIELLRPASIMGRIEGFRRVPFNVLIPAQSAGSVVNWVGEGAAKPVTNPDFTDVTLGVNKIAGIVVMSEELVRLSSPSAEETVRRDLVEQVAAFMDQQFVLPSITATSTRPASVTNGITPVAPSGTDAEALRYDINAALADMDTDNIDLSTLVIVMNGALARGIASLTNALGQKEFPSMTARGGELEGFPVLVSNGSPAGYIVFIVAGEILLADDGVVRLDASNQATLDMDGNGSLDTNLWQKNLIALRAERWVTYKRRRTNATALIGPNAAYGPGDSSP